MFKFLIGVMIAIGATAVAGPWGLGAVGILGAVLCILGLDNGGDNKT